MRRFQSSRMEPLGSKEEEEMLSFARKQKTDVGVIFTAFDENEGARRAHGISDSAEA